MRVYQLFALIALIAIGRAETLFEIKDSSNNTVFNISNDGLRVFNLGDTLMVISADAIRANISSSKGLSRSFSVTTNSSKGKGFVNAFEVGTDETKIGTGSTVMGVGVGGEKYSDLSPVNIFMGLNSGINTTPSGFYGNSNVFIGNSAGYTNTLGQKNIFIGNSAGYTNSEGDYNVFLGHNAGMLSTIGDRNVFIGYESGQSNTIGTANTFVGEGSGTRNIEGFGNSFFGRNAGSENNYGDYNTGIGIDAGGLNTTGNYNSCFGAEAGYNNQTGSSNSIFGYQAGKGVWGTSNSNNCFFGYQSGFSVTSGTGNVFMGFQAGYSETGSNKLYIDNSSTINPLIYGDFDADWIKINGDFDVTSLATVGSLDVNGSANLDYGGSINEFSTDGTMAGNSDSAVPTEKAVRTYISSYVSSNGDNLGNHTATQNIKLNGYYLSNDGGNEGVYVDAAGDVGIGTNAPGSHRLYVTSSSTGTTGSTCSFMNSNSGGVALMAENSSTTSSDTAVLFTQKGSTGDILALDSWHGTGSWEREFRFTNAGNGMCDGSWTGGGADYAEYFIKTDPSKNYEPGDVIEVSIAGKTVESSSSEYSTKVVGVYSTNPVVIGNGSSEGAPENSVLVGMMGVVPTKVTNINGEIKVGDFVTTSSVQGVAMKADKPCLIIGRALQNYNSDGVSKINVLVNPGWAGNEAQIIEQKLRMDNIEEENKDLRSEIDQIKRYLDSVNKREMGYK